MTYAICGKCKATDEAENMAMVGSRRRDGWVAIRCEKCGGIKAAKAAESRRESRTR